jgi:hypothetical protein
MRRSRLVVLLFCMAIALLIPTTARAQVTLVSTFSSTINGGLLFGYTEGTTATGQVIIQTNVLASSFTVPAGPLTSRYRLTQIDVGIETLANGGSGPDVPPFSFQVQLTADNSDYPGEVLESWTVSSSTSSSQIYTVVDGIHLFLVTGHRYWVTVGSGGVNPFGQGSWMDGQPGINLATGDSINGGSFGPISLGESFAFDVKGQPVNFLGPPFGLGYNQILHIVAGPITPTPGTPVEANISFTDINGNALGTSSLVTVNPGQVASFDFVANQFIKPGQRIEVVPVVTPGPNPNGPPTSGIEVSAEVRDALLGFGTGLTPIPLYPPAPVTPSLVTQGLAGLQTMRLTVQAYPLTPCDATVSFADNNGNLLSKVQQVNLTPGTGAPFDLTAESVGLKLGQRMDVQPMVTLIPAIGAAAAPPSACQATVEVFDQFTGRTQTYQTAGVQLPALQ